MDSRSSCTYAGKRTCRGRIQHAADIRLLFRAPSVAAENINTRSSCTNWQDPLRASLPQLVSTISDKLHLQNKCITICGNPTPTTHVHVQPCKLQHPYCEASILNWWPMALKWQYEQSINWHPSCRLTKGLFTTIIVDKQPQGCRRTAVIVHARLPVTSVLLG